jgi:hypothetical protein
MAEFVVLENSQRCNQSPKRLLRLAHISDNHSRDVAECMPWCARKGLDTGDIVREAMLRQTGNASSPIRLYVRMSAEDFRLPT